MEITIRQDDSIRIQVSQAEHFIDVSYIDYQGIRVTAYPQFHYIEVRRKAGQIATFHFKNKRGKKEADLGWWQDAEVVYSCNETFKRLEGE